MRRGMILAPLLIVLLSGSAAATIDFVDRTEDSGIDVVTTNGDLERRYIIDTLGSGAALFDYDGDGDLDVYIANGSRLEGFGSQTAPTGRLYRNDGQGKFEDVTAGTGLEIPFWGFGVATGDYDNDGDPDLYVTSWGPNHLFTNNGDGTFAESGAITGTDDPMLGASAAFFDSDLDGDLDLYVTNYLDFDPTVVPAKGDPDSPCTFRGLTVMCGPSGLLAAHDVLYGNQGDGTFLEIGRDSGLRDSDAFYGLGVSTADVNADGWQDILVANDTTPNQLYINQKDGRFLDDALMRGFAYSNDGREQAGMGIDLADLDGDGDLDSFVTNFSHDYSTLSINDGAGGLEDSSVRLGLVETTVRTLGWGTLLFDADNDGDPDVFIANGHVYPEIESADIGTTYAQVNQMLENHGALSFQEVSLADRIPRLHRGAAGGDIDRDGDIDILLTVMNGRPVLLDNTSTAGSWLAVELVGRRSNRDGVGANVTLVAGRSRWFQERLGGGSYLSASTPYLHFGLGPLKSVDRVEVIWPSGIRQTVKKPSLNRILVVIEP